VFPAGTTPKGACRRGYLEALKLITQAIIELLIVSFVLGDVHKKVNNLFGEPLIHHFGKLFPMADRITNRRLRH